MRGSKSIFADVFGDKPAKHRKGRSETLIKLRNECLVERYFYYGRLSDKRYEAIIKILSSEFFLSPVTIPDIINAHLEKLKQLKSNPPGAAELRRRWPFLNW